MGDRAVISNKNKDLGIYLHWNGDREFVESVLAYCDVKQYRSPDSDYEYGWARLCQVIGNTLGGTLSLGVGIYSKMDTDNWDNGTYIIEGWDIKERLYQHYKDIKIKGSILENLQHINSKQPKDEQLKDEELKKFAELWEVKHIDRLNDERKAYVEAKIKSQEQVSTENKQKVEKTNDKEKQNPTKSDKNGQFMTKTEFINKFSKEFNENIQVPTGKNEIKEQVIPYEILEKNGITYNLEKEAKENEPNIR